VPCLIRQALCPATRGQIKERRERRAWWPRR
jgi:hypothetical protein